MLNVAVVGFGWWGQHIGARLAKHDGFRLTAIAEPQQTLWPKIRALGCDVFPDLEAVLANGRADAVVLTSPNTLHDVQVFRCAEAGVHVFCEKPLSLTAAGAQASVQACRNAGVVLGVGHERRFEPAIQSLKAALDKGGLGTVMHAELAFSHNKLKDLDPTSWRTSKQAAPAAGMTQTGIHLTDLLIWFFGAVTQVHAITADRSLGWETGDLLAVQLQFEAGMTAQLQAILNTPHFLRTHVFGTDAHLEIRNATHPDTPGGEVTMTFTRGTGDVSVERVSWQDAVMANIDAFASAIRGDAPYLFSDFEKLHNIEVLEAIIRSAETGQAVKL